MALKDRDDPLVATAARKVSSCPAWRAIASACADNLSGLGDDDFYYGDNALDVVNEASGAGSDRVFASVIYTLKVGQEIEKLTTGNNSVTGAIDLTGNELANTIFGNNGTNRLNGGGGNDSLVKSMARHFRVQYGAQRHGQSRHDQ